MKSLNHKLILARHGDTDANTDGDKIRGWVDHPLNLQGIQEAYDLAECLKKNEDFDIIISSDLTRAEQTAKIISEITKKPIKGSTAVLRPWNVGELTGKESKAVIPEMEKYVKENPDKKVPEGESFNNFKNRFLDGLKGILDLYPDKTVLIVTHHRNNVMLDGWQKEGFPDNNKINNDEFLKKGIKPADYKVYKIVL